MAEVFESRLLLTTFTVTTDADIPSTIADSGAPFDPLTLRQAILDANANPGADSIVFNIGGGGVRTIGVQSALPMIIDSVNLDATSQPGYAGSPLIQIDGAAAVMNTDGTQADGLRIGGGAGTKVAGLSIGGFAGFGIYANGSYTGPYLSGLHIENCYLGVDATGNVGKANHSGIVAFATDGLQIDNNVLSGNTYRGTYIGSSTNTVLRGNKVGTNAAGTEAIGNGSDGIAMEYQIFNATIGGTNPGDGNLISGSTGVNYGGQNGAAGNGIYLAQVDHVSILGNLIGTDVTGTLPLGNLGGIAATFSTQISVGGTTSIARNVISGNSSYNVSMGHVSDSTVQGNLIGTNAAGTEVLGTQGDGIFLLWDNNILVGGTTPGAGNVISGASFAEVDLLTDNTTVQGNLIGTDVTGTAALGWAQIGVAVRQIGTHNLIGGTSPGAGNLISGNVMGVGFEGVAVHDNVVQGNRIGTDITGTQFIEGSYYGVGIYGSSNNTIGGLGAGEANTIQCSYFGLFFDGSSIGNSIRGNLLGTTFISPIALAGWFGTVLNDTLDADTGANELQNHPMISSAVVGSTTHAAGVLDSTPNETFLVDFYAGTGINGTLRYIGTTSVTTDAAGHAAFDVSLNANTAIGETVLATATNSSGSTSEMSPAAEITVTQVATHTTATGGTFTYDGLSHAGSASVDVSGGVVALSYTGINGTVYYSSTPPTNAGTYQFTATYAGDETHLASSATAVITINKATLPVLVLSDLMLASSEDLDDDHDDHDDEDEHDEDEHGGHTHSVVPALTGTVNGVTFTRQTTFTTAAGTSVTITLSSSVTATSPVGTFPIVATVTGPGAANFVQPASGNLYVVTIGRDAGTGGKNVSFWDNKGNAKLITVAALTALDGLNLRNDNNSNFDPTTATQLQKWLSGNTEHVVKSLSIQLAVMELNVLAGNVRLTDYVYAGKLLQFVNSSYSTTGLTAGGFIRIGDLLTLANNALANASSLSHCDDDHGPLGKYLEVLEDILEDANDNSIFVQQAIT